MIGLLLLPLLLGGTPAGNWPCWRGPHHDGISRETGWRNEGATEPLWTVEVGLGHSSLARVGERLFAFGFDVHASEDVVRCLDAATGEILWRHAYPAQLDANHHGGGTHTTPSVVGDRVWVTNRRGHLLCLDAEDGQLHWDRDLAAEHGTIPGDYGFGGSPLVLGELVICNVSKTVAVDRTTGDPRWATRDHLAFYSTPTPTGDGETLACFSKEGLQVLALATGEVRHQFPWRKQEIAVNAATPVMVDGRIFISSAYRHGCALLDFTAEDPVVFAGRAMRNKLSTSVRMGDALYGFDEGTLKCIDLTGKERWRKRGLGSGALSAADGRLLVASEDGELLVVEATPEGFRELSRRRVFEHGPVWGAPVLAGGVVYLRNAAGTMVALDHRPRAPRSPVIKD